MTVRPLLRAEVRELDRLAIAEGRVPGVVLMENAGRGAADWLGELGIRGLVLICCGKGNNGGDGFVIARHLDAAGKQVHVLLACDPSELRGDARTNFEALSRTRVAVSRWQESGEAADDAVPQRLLAEAEWIVDGLLGTGAEGTVREPMRRRIEAINRSDARRFAIDIPSGLDADSGVPLGTAVVAAYTATFVAQKRGFLNPMAAGYLGEVRVLPIGIPRALLEKFG